MEFLKNTLKTLIRPYYFVKTRYPVWLLLNIDGVFLQKRRPLPLDVLQKRIADTIIQDGVCIVDIDELFPGEGLLKKLQGDLAAFKPADVALSDKYFYRDYWDMNRFLLDISNPFLAFAVRDRFLAIVNTYLGMYSRLHSLRLMKTVVVKDGFAPEQSQLWHRDGGSVKYLKVFLYLNDVDDGTGPFFYVKGSHQHGRWHNLFPHPLPHTPRRMRTEDKKLEHIVPPEDIVKCTGKAGTLVFCDTAGLHKGGYSTKTERITLLPTFFGRASTTPLKKRKKFIFPENFNKQIHTLSTPAQFAVRKAPWWR